METKEAIAAVIKEDGLDSAIAWIAGVVDEKHNRIEALERALRDKDDIAYVIDSHGMTHQCFTIVYRSALENWRQEARAALGEKKDG